MRPSVASGFAAGDAIGNQARCLLEDVDALLGAISEDAVDRQVGGVTSTLSIRWASISMISN